MNSDKIREFLHSKGFNKKLLDRYSDKAIKEAYEEIKNDKRFI